MQDKIRFLGKTMAKTRRTMVFTGAGVSTESGIPDFRGRKGVWRDMDAVKLLSLDTLYGNPPLFYTKGVEFLETLRGKQPNPAHRAIAELENMGVVSSVVTQNIDGLHQLGGSQNVIEIHGNLRTCRCRACPYKTSWEDMRETAKRGEIPPLCPECGGWVRPCVVFFEDPMTEDFARAMDEARNSDLVLVVGSSLQVAPASYVPEVVPQMAIINLEPTPYDPRASVVINGRAGQVLPKLVDMVKMHLA